MTPEIVGIKRPSKFIIKHRPPNKIKFYSPPQISVSLDSTVVLMPKFNNNSVCGPPTPPSSWWVPQREKVREACQRRIKDWSRCVCVCVWWLFSLTNHMSKIKTQSNLTKKRDVPNPCTNPSFFFPLLGGTLNCPIVTNDRERTSPHNHQTNLCKWFSKMGF